MPKESLTWKRELLQCVVKKKKPFNNLPLHKSSLLGPEEDLAALGPEQTAPAFQGLLTPGARELQNTAFLLFPSPCSSASKTSLSFLSLETPPGTNLGEVLYVLNSPDHNPTLCQPAPCLLLLTSPIVSVLEVILCTFCVPVYVGSQQLVNECCVASHKSVPLSGPLNPHEHNEVAE